MKQGKNFEDDDVVELKLLRKLADDACVMNLIRKYYQLSDQMQDFIITVVDGLPIAEDEELFFLELENVYDSKEEKAREIIKFPVMN